MISAGTDLYQSRHVAIVSEGLARKWWGSPRAALGKRIRSAPTEDWREIVGVAGDIYDRDIRRGASPMVYWAAIMDNFWGDKVHVQDSAVFVIRTRRASTPSFVAEARRAIWSVDPNLPVFQVQTLQDVYDYSMARTSFTMTLLIVAGATALMIGLVGLAGVISYLVSQRTREIGVRIALGAAPAGVLGILVSQGLLLASIGALVALTASAVLTRLMRSLLFGTEPLDPLTYVVITALLLLCGSIASYLSARRATTVNPSEALRSE